MYSKILAPVDGSERAEKAVVHAAELASRLGAGLTVLHVIPPLPVFVSSPFAPSPNLEELVSRESVKFGKEVLEKAKEKLDGYKMTYDTEMVMGHPDIEICKIIKEGKYDLVVLGSRGLGELKGYLLGSVSGRVARHASCPVLIVR